MIDNATSPAQTFTKTIVINATTAQVWAALTYPEQMKQWMTEAAIEISTDWQPGSPITIQGDWYKTQFENRGTVLQVAAERLLRYSHLSSLSRLPDKTENYCILEFRLAPQEAQTILTFTASNFPTETIYRHLAFYWNVALELLKKFVEQ